VYLSVADLKLTNPFRRFVTEDVKAVEKKRPRNAVFENRLRLFFTKKSDGWDASVIRFIARKNETAASHQFCIGNILPERRAPFAG
jgi:hypothetical protein